MDEYRVSNQTQWAHFKPTVTFLVVIILSGCLLVYYKGEDYTSAVIRGFAFLFSIQVFPQLALHLNYLSLNETDTLLFNSNDKTYIFIHDHHEIKFHVNDIAHIVRFQSFRVASGLGPRAGFDYYQHMVITLYNGSRIVITSLMDAGVLNFPISAEKIEVKRNIYRWATGPSLVLPRL